MFKTFNRLHIPTGQTHVLRFIDSDAAQYTYSDGSVSKAVALEFMNHWNSSGSNFKYWVN